MAACYKDSIWVVSVIVLVFDWAKIGKDEVELVNFLYNNQFPMLVCLNCSDTLILELSQYYRDERSIAEAANKELLQKISMLKPSGTSYFNESNVFLTCLNDSQVSDDIKYLMYKSGVKNPCDLKQILQGTLIQHGVTDAAKIFQRSATKESPSVPMAPKDFPMSVQFFNSQLAAKYEILNVLLGGVQANVVLVFY